MLTKLILDKNKETIIGEIELRLFRTRDINSLYSGMPVELPTGITIIVKGIKLDENYDVEALYVDEI